MANKKYKVNYDENVVEDKKGINFLGSDISFGGTGLAQVVIFAKNLSVMIKSSLTISESLDIAADSMSGRFKKIILSVLSAVNSGSSLSDGFKQYPKVFPNIFISSVYAGEKSGTLEQNLDYVANQLEKERDLSQKIKSSMIYPVVVLTATFLLGMTLAFLVLPKIIPLFQGLGGDLPFTTRTLIWLSTVVQDHGTVLFLSIVGTLFVLIWLARQRFSRPVTNLLLLYTPIIRKISKNANLVRFCRTLGTLLKSGLTIDESMAIAGDTVGNYYYKKAVKNIAKSMSAGGASLSSSLEGYESLFPKLVVRMIKVGEESGKLDENLLYLASFYESEVDNSTKTLSTSIEPILLIIIGLAVGFLALSIITPIYNITGNISQQ
jgi:type II secretory pathway component PulF